MPLSFPFSGRIMLPGTATECLAFSEQKPAPPNAKSFRVNEGGASHRLHQLSFLFSIRYRNPGRERLSVVDSTSRGLGNDGRSNPFQNVVQTQRSPELILKGLGGFLIVP
jgi:hypothetical protein